MTKTNTGSTIYKKLHKIMKDVDFIQKDKTNENQNYSYASERIIKETLHEKLVENAILFQLEVNDAQYNETNSITTITCTYHFIDVETGEELKGSFAGQGWDKTDKGMYKAITGAIKYALTSTFLIPTGDDPENEVDKPDIKSEDVNDVLTQKGFPDKHKDTICPIHKVPMKKYTKNGNSWYAHQNDNGSWCNGGD